MATIEASGEASLTPAAPLRLSGSELEVALGEVDAVLAMVPPGDYRERLEELRGQLVGDGPDGDGILELDRLLGIALQSGRLRAVYGPGGESAATRLYRKLPSGRELASSAGEVSDALRSLSGQVLDDVVVTANGPGAFGLALTVGGREIAIRLDRQGVRLHSVGA
jgi:hypothetical protein